MITIFKPFVSQRARDLVQEVLSGTQLAEGPVVKAFEKLFGEVFHFKNVCAVNSGTTALELAYELAGIGSGDEVITPVLTCTATNLPILHHGGTPVFADINSDLVLDVNDVKKRITQHTKAIVYVHFGGFTGGLKAIQELAAEYGLPVIEDAAQCIGAPLGEWGTSEFTCVSLQAIKTLTSGDGGMLICKDDFLHEKAKRLRWFGYDRDMKQAQGDIDLVEVGYKYHMNDISAAIGLGNLESIEEVLTAREKVREMYRKTGLHILLRPWVAILICSHMEQLEKAFADEGIKISGYHYRNDKYTIFGGRRNDLPTMDLYENCYTLLPFHHALTQDDINKISSIIKRVIN